MLGTVSSSRNMEFIPQIAEPAVRLHLLVVDVDGAIRSACAELAASMGYAVESTGDMSHARRLLRGENTVLISYTLLGGNRPIDLELKPLFALRGIHDLMYQWNGLLEVETTGRGHHRIPATTRATRLGS